MRKLIAVLALATLPALALASTSLPVQTVSKTGVAPTRMGLSSTETYKVRNNGRTLLLFEKTGAGIATVTITTPGTVGGIAIADQTVSIPASTGDKVVGPMAPSIFNDSNGDFSFTVNDTIGLSVAVVRF